MTTVLQQCGYELMSDYRINARLDEEAVEDLQLLKDTLGDTSTTNILKYSLQRSAEEIRAMKKARQQKKVWRESGFIGSFDGPEDLSSNYKKYLTEVVNDKYSAPE
jgi:hypothetical protein